DAGRGECRRDLLSRRDTANPAPTNSVRLCCHHARDASDEGGSRARPGRLRSARQRLSALLPLVYRPWGRSMSDAELQPLFDDLKSLTTLPGTSGFEQPVVRALRERLTGLADEVEVDAIGNVYGIMRGSEGGCR